jgi:hypothetical protein
LALCADDADTSREIDARLNESYNATDREIYNRSVEIKLCPSCKSSVSIYFFINGSYVHGKGSTTLKSLALQKPYYLSNTKNVWTNLITLLWTAFNCQSISWIVAQANKIIRLNVNYMSCY